MMMAQHLPQTANCRRCDFQPQQPKVGISYSLPLKIAPPTLEHRPTSNVQQAILTTIRHIMLELSSPAVNYIQMKNTEPTLTMKVVRGRNTHEPMSQSTAAADIWRRFDRLQRSVAPLRKGQRTTRGIHYGNGS